MGDVLRVKTSAASQLSLPEPAALLMSSDGYSSPLLKGLRLDPEDPLHIEFVIDTASEADVSKEEASRLIRYFLAGLTIPQDSLWVNLSPEERDRVIEEDLGQTDLGRDMLAQDYVLKQLASSLTHPDTPIGEAYWRVENGKLTIENRLGKIWIVPDKSVVHEQGTMALITEASLKAESESVSHDVLLPAITRELNHGRHFSLTRQLYHSLILAVWFKKKFEESFYACYLDKSQVNGIDIEDKAVKDKIWNLYCEAFRKGVYDVLRTSVDSGQIQIQGQGKRERRRYFSGGQNYISSSLKPEVKSGIGADEIGTAEGNIRIVHANVVYVSDDPHRVRSGLPMDLQETVSIDQAFLDAYIKKESDPTPPVTLVEVTDDLARQAVLKTLGIANEVIVRELDSFGLLLSDTMRSYDAPDVGGKLQVTGIANRAEMRLLNAGVIGASHAPARLAMRLRYIIYTAYEKGQPRVAMAGEERGGFLHRQAQLLRDGIPLSQDNAIACVEKALSYVEQGASAASAMEEVGGIDMKNLAVEADPISSVVEWNAAGFGPQGGEDTGLKGLRCEIVDMRDADIAAVLAMAGH